MLSRRRWPAQRLLQAAAEPQNWLTYSGGYSGQRYSTLKQIDPANVKNLEMKWMLQTPVAGSWESSPLVVDGVMYLTQRPNDVVALDAKTGRIFWIYKYVGSPDYKVCCGANNRGLAILGDTPVHGHARRASRRARRAGPDACCGTSTWRSSRTAIPSASRRWWSRTRSIIGVGGGEYGIRGFIAAYDAATGKEAWRFNTIPAPGEPGSETWSGDAWKSGGGSIWVTGTYDPESEPDLLGRRQSRARTSIRRSGRATTSTPNSVVALDADTGELQWHFQFTPHDRYDWDATQVPVLVDTHLARCAARSC